MAELAWYHFLIGGILIVASIFIVLFVMLQESRQAGLSGAIAGGSDSFYEKNKKKRQLSYENCRFFLVSYRRFELRTPCLKGRCSAY